jgi:hypothetical protein
MRSVRCERECGWHKRKKTAISSFLLGEAKSLFAANEFRLNPIVSREGGKKVHGTRFRKEIHFQGKKNKLLQTILL